jgi:hypothetical protein
VYPGNTQSRHRNEKAMKGFYEVSLTKERAELHFITSSAFIYDEIEVSCDGIVHANELIERIVESLQTYRQSNGSSIVELSLTHIGEEAWELLQSSTKEEWLAIIQESIDGETPFMIVQRLTFDMPQDELKESTMILQMIEEWNTANWKHALKELYQHPKGGRYLQTIEQDFIEEMRQEAELLLSNVVTKRSE